MHEWKEIDSADAGDGYTRTYRMAVPGGYLYLHEMGTPNSEESWIYCTSMAFVPSQRKPPKARRVKKSRGLSNPEVNSQ